MAYVPTEETVRQIHDLAIAEIQAKDFPTAVLSPLYIKRIIGYGDQVALAAKIVEWEGHHALQNAPKPRVRLRVAG
jgi:hypothetical protein